MSNTLHEIERLRERARCGDPSAARDFEMRFGSALHRVVRRQVRRIEQTKGQNAGLTQSPKPDRSHNGAIVSSLVARAINRLLNGCLVRGVSLLAKSREDRNLRKITACYPQDTLILSE